MDLTEKQWKRLEPLIPEAPKRADGRGYDSALWDAKLANQGTEMIALHRRNRTRPKTQDGRKLRRYKRR